MTTLQISKEKAKELYPTASTEFKTMLEETFGKDFFKVSITDRVKSFDQAWWIYKGFKDKGYPCPEIYERKDESAFFQLKIITEVLNEGKEGKWFPVFDSYNICFKSHFNKEFSYYPRKLLLATKELSDYAGTQFIELYKDYLL